MKNWKPLPGIAAVLFTVATLAAIVICPSALFACGGDPPPPPPDPTDSWKAGGPITISMTSPDNNEYVSVRSIVRLSADAEDYDSYGSGSDWHSRPDEVNSGETEYDYHKWWEHEGDGKITDAYGEGEYEGPHYNGAKPDVRTVTITAHADDFDRGDDAVQYDDPAVSTSRTINIWQVTISIRQTGIMDKTTWYDGPPLFAAAGGGKLDWITHGTPAGAASFCMSTEISGRIPAEVPLFHTIPPEAWFVWIQRKKGTKSKRVGAEWSNEYHEETYQPDFAAEHEYVDFDPRSPNSEQGTDHDKVFCWDAPGFQTGPQNNAKILPPFKWREYKHDMYYKIFLKYNGNRISNILYWDLFFHLKAKPGPGDKYDENAKWEEITHER